MNFKDFLDSLFYPARYSLKRNKLTHPDVSPHLLFSDVNQFKKVLCTEKFYSFVRASES